jgi:hypothetical protein
LKLQEFIHSARILQRTGQSPQFEGLAAMTFLGPRRFRRAVARAAIAVNFSLIAALYLFALVTRI